jgi:uncharacterized protein YdeI (YjbR/CyaY-like superfamily)
VQIKSFKSAPAFREWLDKNHASSPGIWLRFYKKDSGKATVTYAEALDHSLCHGWIDGQRKSYDELSFLQKFTPRRSKSAWSKLNTQHARRLIKSGAMAPAGLKAIKAAKADGRWRTAYDSPAKAKPPADFLKELEKDKKAKAFFATLEKRNSYSICYRLQTAKTPEIREKRMKLILNMLAKGEKFHP